MFVVHIYFIVCIMEQTKKLHMKKKIRYSGKLLKAIFFLSSNLLISPFTAEWSSWLPLYGNLCCQLVAQPVCMAQNIMSGYLNHKVDP